MRHLKEIDILYLYTPLAYQGGAYKEHKWTVVTYSPNTDENLPLCRLASFWVTALVAWNNVQHIVLVQPISVFATANTSRLPFFLSILLMLSATETIQLWKRPALWPHDGYLSAFFNSFNFLNYYAFSAFLFFLQCRLSQWADGAVAFSDIVTLTFVQTI